MQKGAIYLEQDYIANRREYILRARNSFSESRKDTDEELINTGKAAIWKVKWLLCICLFVVFVLCDKGKLPFPGQFFYFNKSSSVYSPFGILAVL